VHCLRVPDFHTSVAEEKLADNSFNYEAVPELNECIIGMTAAIRTRLHTMPAQMCSPQEIA